MISVDHRLQVADYVVFSVIIVISIGIGVYYACTGSKQRTITEFILGNKRMQVIPVAISLLVSFESSIMVLGFPAEVYVYGIMIILQQFGFLAANLISAKLFIPFFYRLKLTSINEYLQFRFNSFRLRMLGAILGILLYSTYLGIVLYGPGIALESVTGFPFSASIILLSLASMIYTAIGGLKAVVWTDVFQCVIMFTGLIAIFVKGCIDVGGFGEVWRIAGRDGRLNFFNFSPNPLTRHTFWTLVFPNIVRGIGLAFNQSSIQRISSTRSARDSTKIFLVAAPLFFVVSCFSLVMGLVVYAYFRYHRCDPLENGSLSNPNQIMLFFAVDAFRSFPGVPGLFVATLFSASLSTLSSGFSSLSTITWIDILQPHLSNVSEIRAAVYAKLAVAFYGVLATGVAFVVSLVGGTLVEITGSLISLFSGPLTGLFVIAILCPWANEKGAIAGTLTSIMVSGWLVFGKSFSPSLPRNPKLPPGPTDNCNNFSKTSTGFENYTATEVSPLTMATTAYSQIPKEPIEGLDNFYAISYQLIGMLGMTVVIVVSAVVSLITDRYDPKKVDTRYGVSFFDELFCCLPEFILKHLRCGVDYKTQKKAKIQETELVVAASLKFEKQERIAEGIETSDLLRKP